MKNHMDDLNEMEDILETDMLYAISLIVKSPQDEAVRRIAIRSIFAYIEGFIYSLKQTMFEISKTEGIALTKEDREKITELCEGAAPGKEKRKISLRENLLYSIKLAKKVANSDHIIDTRSSDYAAFFEAIPIRDRLMHPKSKKDLKIDLDDVKRCQFAGRWFHDQYTAILASRRKP